MPSGPSEAEIKASDLDYLGLDYLGDYLDCWGPGESIDTHFVGVGNKKGKVTSAYPRCPQGPGGPESGQIAKS